MKKAMLLCTVAAVVFSFAASAQAAPYASAKAVYSWERPKIKDDEGSGATTFKAPGLNVAVGYGFDGVRTDDNIRVEAEYGYRALKSELDEDEDGIGQTKFGLQTYMINGYYDLSTGTMFKPYAGLGLGLAKVKIKYADEDTVGTISKTKFAWNIGAGVGIEVAKNVTVDLGYRFLQVDDFKEGGSKFSTKANEVSLGVRFDF